jgi:hypothetical protein
VKAERDVIAHLAPNVEAQRAIGQLLAAIVSLEVKTRRSPVGLVPVPSWCQKPV